MYRTSEITKAINHIDTFINEWIKTHRITDFNAYTAFCLDSGSILMQETPYLTKSFFNHVINELRFDAEYYDKDKNYTAIIYRNEKPIIIVEIAKIVNFFGKTDKPFEYIIRAYNDNNVCWIRNYEK